MIPFLLALAVAAALPNPLSLSQAVALAVKNNLDLNALRASRTIASGQVRLAAALPAPEFRLSTNNLGLDPETLEARTSVGLRWSPPRPGEMNLKQQAALAGERVVQAEIRSAEAHLAAEVRLAYRRTALAEERVRLAREGVGIRGRMLDLVRRQVAAGLKEAVDIDLAELTLADAETELRRAETLAAGEKRRLARLIEPSGEMDFALAPESSLFRSPSLSFDRQEMASQAISRRADLDQAARACEQARAAEALSRRLRYPWISFVQATRRVSELPDRGSWGFQIGIDLPLFRSAAAAEARVAVAERQRCDLQEQALRARIRHEVEDAIASLEATAHELLELERLYSGGWRKGPGTIPGRSPTGPCGRIRGARGRSPPSEPPRPLARTSHGLCPSGGPARNRGWGSESLTGSVLYAALTAETHDLRTGGTCES